MWTGDLETKQVGQQLLKADFIISGLEKAAFTSTSTSQQEKRRINGFSRVFNKGVIHTFKTEGFFFICETQVRQG